MEKLMKHLLLLPAVFGMISCSAVGDIDLDNCSSQENLCRSTCQDAGPSDHIDCLEKCERSRMTCEQNRTRGE